jgi:hypothetical protein
MGAASMGMGLCGRITKVGHKFQLLKKIETDPAT